MKPFLLPKRLPKHSPAAVALALIVGGAYAMSACSLLPGEDETSSFDATLCSDDANSFRFPSGGDGHEDPLGAAAAHQARAGKITHADQIFQPADARHKIRKGDFALANDKVVAYIEAEGISDGYVPFGGEILGLEPLDPSGKPLGVSYFDESAILFGLETFAPEKVSVVADGSDGQAAIVRATGVLKMIPMLDAFSALFPDRYGWPAALDYVLEPGSSRVKLRVNLANTHTDQVDFTGKVNLGYFQESRSQTFTEQFGFEAARGDLRFVGWQSQGSAFLTENLLGPMQVALEISGLQIFTAPALKIDGCTKQTVDYLEFMTAAPGIDDLLEIRRKAVGEPAWREIRGVLREAGSGPLAGAMVHATADSGYLTRATTSDDGSFVLHVPAGAVSVTPTLKGWSVPAATPLDPSATTLDLTLPARSTIAIDAVDADTHEPLPSRIQIIPDNPAFRAPEAFGVKDEPDDRLYREYVADGHLSVPVPPGGHRVVVTRGYEYELFDTPVSVEAGASTQLFAELKHSVDSTGVMCADFHIHSYYSMDSSDDVEKKVRGAVADGLEIPISSEHEYVIDFDPILQRLGLAKWAFGMPSEELTTFSFGHFGIVPMEVQPDAVNHGALDWVGKKPPELFPVINALPQKPLLIVNHPSDSAMGYFAMSGFDRGTTTGQKDLWSDAFTAIEVFNASDFEDNRDQSVGDWFAMLNAGKIRWAVGSSDSHDLSKTPVGYPRTCLPFGHDDPRRLTAETVRDVVRSGAAIVSGGLTMTVQAPGGILPGGTAQAGDYKIVIQSPGWITASSLEVIVDGVTTQTLDVGPSVSPGPGKRWELTVNVAAARSSTKHWVVFHAKGDGNLAPLHPEKKPFAVSNPIFF